MLVNFSSTPFYTDHIRLPWVGDPIPNYILGDPKPFPFFQDALRAINGLHFNACTTTSDQDALCDHNGALTTNTLAVCDFNMWVLHIQSRWEGSAANAQMFYDARFTNLPVPNGKYFLADAGFLTCSPQLIPYHGLQYHLAEWGCAQLWYRYRCYHYTFAHHPNFVVPPHQKSYSICNTWRLGMSSRGYLE